MTGPDAESLHPEPHLATADLIAIVADISPHATALTGTTGPIDFADLAARLAPTVAVFLARGVDSEAAVLAALSGVVSRPEHTPAQNAAAARAAVDAVRAAARTAMPAADWTSLPGLFAVTARRHPERIAVTDAAGATLTYRELVERSDALARNIIDRGVVTGDIVGLAHERTVDLVVAILGVLRAGAAYLPLDTSHPVDRLRMVVADAQPVLLLTDEVTPVAHELGVRCVTVGAASTGNASGNGQLANRIDPRLAAYVIFTSGSTGRPKGVTVEHRQVMSLMQSARREFTVDENDVWTMFHSHAFDFSVWELWGPLLTGGRMVLVDRDVARDPVEFLALLDSQRVTVLSQTPSAFYQLIDARRRHPTRLDLRYVVFGGEALSFEQVRRWYDEHSDDDAVLVNMYGITETTVHVTVRPLDAATVSGGKASLVGGALHGLRVHILDAQLQPVPPGVTGEIYVSGGQLGRGYLNRPGLSASRFVANPFGAPGERMYRSGDLARHRGADIEYLGRGDAQIQLRGYRIEFGEVEAALLAVPGVTAAAAAVKHQAARGEQLVGYLVTDPAGAQLVEIATVRTMLARRLPDYMVPDVVMTVDVLPLNVNGKLDRMALPEPRTETIDYEAPGSSLEHTLAAIVAEVLGERLIGVTESVLDRGVNSLIAAQIAARCAEELDVAVGVRDVFEASTVRELAERLGHRTAAHRPELRPAARPDVVPLSYAQRRLWFLAQMQPGSLYNIPFALRFRGEVRPADLECALYDVIDRHESLRTRFPTVDGIPHQDIRPRGYRGHDIVVAAPQAIADTEVAGLVGEVAGRGFDLAAAAPVRARLFRIRPDEHVFVLVMHHVISDGGSVAPFARDLMLAYNARVGGRPPAQPELPVQYADYALWQRELLGDPEDPGSIGGAQLEHWARELAGAPEVIELPTDRPRPPAQSGRAGAYVLDLPNDVCTNTVEFARSQGVSLFMVLHTAVVVTLHRLGAGDDVVVGTPYAGRGERGLDDLVGMFVNTVVLRVALRAGEDFATILRRVRDVDLGAFDQADIPFEMLVERVRPTRSHAHAPLCQVMINLQDTQNVRLELADVTVDVLEQHRVLTDLDLSISFVRYAAERPGTPPRMSVILEYATDLFDAPTIGLFGEVFETVLAAGIAQPSTPVGDIEIGAHEVSDAPDAAEFGAVRDVSRTLLGDGLLEQAARTPDAVALIAADDGPVNPGDGHREVTYAELTARVVSLARVLIACGVGPEVAVGVCIARSVESVVAVHAIALAGGQFVPIDVRAPATRIGHIIGSAGIRWVICADGPRPAGLPESGVDVVAVRCSGPVSVTTPFDPAERRAPLRPDNAAYTLFTSGSTGRPKGVTVTHRAIAAHLAWRTEELEIGPQDVVLFATPLTFDPAVWQVFGPLTVGATVSIARADVDPAYLIRLMADTGVTVYHTVPSVLAEVLAEARQTGVAVDAPLRLVISGGEAIGAQLVGEVRDVLGAEVANSYGPTETTITSNHQLLGDGSAVVALGGPVHNTVALILDERMHRVPAGVAGELYLGGIQLARGYAGSADLTAGRFVADPYGAPGARLYRTGDRVRRTRSGHLEYLGRNDFQVKLRGQRIELEEVERAVETIAGVRSAAAAVRDDVRSGMPQLVGYVCPEAGTTVDTAQLGAAVASVLPAYMYPSAWVILETMPRTTSGKLDRRALPQPEFEERESVSPATPTEEVIASVFAGVLGTDQVSVVESFFDLGGNSLSAMRVVARVGEAVGTDIAVRDVFDAPSVRELAEAIGSGAARSSTATGDLIPATDRPQRPPLSFAQQRLWFINQLEPTSGAYNLPEVVRLAGPLDTDALRAAVIDVMMRHEILRTTFPHADGVAYQQVSDSDAVSDRLDWAMVATAADLRRGCGEGFDLTREWPIRVRLRRVAADQHELAVVVHHIACDGESVATLFAELLACYRARHAGGGPALIPLELQYVDYAIWQRNALGAVSDPDSVVGRQLAYWRTQLAGTPDLLALPTSRPRPAIADPAGGRIDFTIAPELAERVEHLARESGATTFMVLHAALTVLLARLGSQDDIAVATPVSGRGDRRLEALVGMFVNTLILRVRVDPEESMRELLRKVRATDLDALAQADAPFESVVDAVGPTRSQSFSPFTEVMLSVDPVAVSALGDVAVGDLRVRAAPHPVPVQRDLTFAIATGARAGREWTGALLFATALFDDDLAESMAGRFLDLLRDLTAAPDRPVGDAEILDPHESATMRRWSSGRTVAVAGPPTLAELAWTAARYGARDDAVVMGERVLDYGSFAELVNTTARQLLAAGLEVDQAVAVCMNRSVELVVALHAVVVAGGHYVPLDPAGPLERTAAIIEDSAAALILAGPGTPAGIESVGPRALQVDTCVPADGVGDRDPVTDAERRGSLRPDNAAYTLFTSGSTGRPKGVAVSHRAIMNRLWWMAEGHGIGPGDRVLQKTPATFDVSVWEFFLPFLTRSVLVVAEPGGHRDPRYLADLISTEQITVAHFVPSMLAVFTEVSGARPDRLTSLRLLFTSGEALTPAAAASARAIMPRVQLHNLYGPTEAAVDVTAWAYVPGSTSIPIGTPVWNTRTLVLDSRFHPVPAGVVGELYLSGVQLARGYVSRAGLTAASFVADPFGPPGARMYRTGDRVRWNPEGQLEYLGRNDFQVKIRGQRVELGEIEAVLASAPGVVHCAVAVHQGPAGARLIGYVSGDDANPAVLDEVLGRALPEYMRPEAWIVLASMPLTVSGKVDRRALPEPGDVLPETVEHIDPATPTESALADIVASVLGIDRVGVCTSFFAMGGHSLAAMRVVARAADTLGVRVAVRDLFDAPTVRALAAVLDGRDGGPHRLVAGPRPERLPLSPAQRRMWFINQFDTGTAAYNISSAFRAGPDLDPVRLAEALGDVTTRHEVLRTIYPADADGPYQQIIDEQTARVMLDWSVTDDPAEFATCATRGFDVATELPLRGRVLCSPASTDVVLTVHHIAFDGESRAVLVRELITAYAHRSGAGPAPHPLPVQYADYALWQADRLAGPDSDLSVRQMEYWRTHLVDLPEVTEVAPDRPRPAVMDTRGARLRMPVPDSVADAADEVARGHGITPFMACHAAFAITIARLAATDDVVLGTVVAGRDDPALTELIGMFVQTVVLRTRVDPGRSVRDFVADVRRVDVDAFDNADVAFDDLVDTLVTDRSPAYAPLVQIGFSYVGADAVRGTEADGRADLPVTGVAPIDLEVAPTVKLDLQLTVAQRVGRSPMVVEIDYATALFDESTIERLARMWMRALQTMATDPTAAVGDIDLVDDRQSPIVVRRNSLGGESPAPDGGTTEPRPVIELLRRVRARPEHPALICGDTVIGYGEYEARTNRIARALVDRGARVGDVVAVGVQRSAASVLAIIGVLKTGAAFVAIDPAYPQHRIDHMITDSGVALGITTRRDRPRLGDSGCVWIDLDSITDDRYPLHPLGDDELGGPVRVDDLAYLVYTSGSTGLPKAVGVSSRGIANLLGAQSEIVESGPSGASTRVLHVASTSFDAAVFEILYALGAGHTLVVAGQAEYAGQALTHVIERHRVTDMVITPTVLATVDVTRAVTVTNLSVVGEACPPELVRRWTTPASPRRMFNLYGPSETTVWATTGALDADRPVTIGRGIRGFATYVLDNRLHRVPVGVVGELYLGARDSLARGYLGQPARTARSFVADPFCGVPGARMYATGDLVRLRADGRLEFAGRADDQIKINGQRVEPGEVEAVLTSSPQVSAAVVRAVRTAAGRTALVAYVVGTSGPDRQASLETEVMAYATSVLAAHLVPRQIIEIDALPVSPGGKLDVRRLPEPDTVPPGRAHDDEAAQPQTHEEVTLARIVAGLLGSDRVDVTQSFFTLGGDSIMSIQLASAARAAGLPISPREIFEHRTVRAMAAAVREHSAQRILLEEGPGGARGDLPLPPVVSWMLEQASTAEDFAGFSQSAVLAAPVELTAIDMAEMVAALADAHPMLTARLHPARGGWHLEVTGEFDAAWAVSEIRTSAPAGSPAFDEEIVAAHADACAALDPAAGNLVRAAIVWSADGVGRVVLVIHHLAVDAVSWPILIEDLITAWTQLTAQAPVRLRPEVTSQRTWITELTRQPARHGAERDYWLARLPERPTDLGGPRPPGPHTLDSFVHVVDSEVADAVLALVPDALGGNVADVLLGALARAVRSWQRARGISGTDPISVLVEGHGRHEDALGSGPDARVADLSRTVGWFTTVAPMSIDPDTDAVHAAKAAKEERLRQPGHGLGFGVLRYTGDRLLAGRPLPTIGFNYLGAAGGSAVSDGPWLPAPGAPRLPSDVGGTRIASSLLSVDVSVLATEPGRALRADFGHAREVLASADVAELARIWEDELAAIVDAARSGADFGPSPSDVPGELVTQADLDDIVTRYPGAAVWGLSPLQKGLYFQSQLGIGDGVDVYLTQAILRLAGTVDVDRLRWATDELLVHHRVLRSGFVRTSSGRVVAVIPARARVGWQVVEGGEITPAEVARNERRQPFAFDAPPLLRVVVIGDGNGDETAVVVTAHHLLFDGWSGPLVLADLLSLYATGTTFTTRRGSDGAGDFAQHLARIAAADIEAGLAAWRRVLEPLDGPTLVAPGATATADALPADHTVVLERDLVSALERVAATHGATVATVLQVAWAILLSRLTGSRVVTFGEIVSGRPADLAGAAEMVGLFVNTLPVVVDTDPDAPVSSVLATLQHNKIAVLDHQQIGLSDITALTGFGPLFDTVVVHESYPVDADALADAGGPATGGLNIIGIEANDSTHYPLNLSTAPRGDRMRLTLKYLPSAFDTDRISVLTESLLAVLRTVVTAPATPVGDVLLLGPDVGLVPVPVSGGPPVPARTMAELFAEAAARGGDRVAVRDPAAPVGSSAQITYAELDVRSNRLARYLIRRGVGPEALVALAVGRSVDLMVAVWAVAKAGAGYVPIDPDYPAERIALIAHDCGAVLGLTVGSPESLPDTGYEWIALDEPVVRERISSLSAATVGERDILARVRPENPAFVIYTSGSTGRPKGVVVPHSGLANVAETEIRRFGVTADSVVMGFATPSFDASVFEYLMALSAVATLVYRPADVVGGPGLEEFIRDNAITHTFLTPSVLATMSPREVPNLQAVVVGGEAVPARLIDDWAPRVRIYDGYGPTETTIIATLGAALSPGDPIDIGMPIPGVDLYVLDARLHPVPPGFAGELYLGGAALARAYTGRPDITAQRFVAHPFAGPDDRGARLYRTGDEVRWMRTPSGSLVLEYLGRTDFQVKLRGLRIELGEIEAALDRHPAVSASAVIGVGGSVAKALAAYVVVDSPVAESELREFVAQHLPGHMVPAGITLLDALPLTPVGKVDRKALPEPTLVVGTFEPAQTPSESLVAAAFGEVLELERVSVTESFFDIGGDSLSATRLAARVSAALGVEVSVRDIFDAPTVRALTGHLIGRDSGLPPVTVRDPRPQPVPLSFAQMRMWFVNRFDQQSGVESGAYNIPIGVRLTGELDVDALHQAVDDVVARHESLRTTFPDVDGTPQQVIHPVGSQAARADWAVVGSREDLLDAARTGFDVTAQVPLRVRLLPAGEREWLLLAVIHHMIGDGESMRPLVSDIIAAYLARLDGRTPEFEPLPVQFADVAIWQHETLGSPDDPDSRIGAALAYWRDQLVGIPDVMGLPTDRPRPPVASHRGAMHHFEIPADLAGEITGLAARASATPFMVLHTALALTVSRMAAEPDVVIATPIAGRGQAELEGLIGMFVNTLVLRTPIDVAATFAELLGTVRTTDLEAYAHAEAPFEMVVDRCNPVRSQAFAPLAQVMLNVVQRMGRDDEARFGPLTVEALEPLVVPAQLDLSVQVTIDEGGPWIGSVVYATDLFDETTIANVVDTLRRTLAAATRHPRLPVERLELTDPERLRLVADWAEGRRVPDVLRGTVADAVVAQVRSVPDRVAMIFGGRVVGDRALGDREMSYREFGARVATLARELIGLGVGPETAVGVCAQRSVELVIAVHAVVAAGGQYVPFDPEMPPERLRYQRDIVGTDVFLVAAGGHVDMVALLGEPVTVLEVDAASVVDMTVRPVTDAERSTPLQGKHPAYTLFTSGSTGRPKGVTVTHGSVVSMLAWCAEAMGEPAGQRMMVKAPFTFDASVVEMFWPSTVGATAVIAEPGGHRDPVYLCRLAEAAQVTVALFVPPMLSAFLDAVEQHGFTLPALETVLCGGDALMPAQAARCKRLLGVRMGNKYGPTEATVDLTHHEITGTETVMPIGAPGWNARTVILDARLRPVPMGVVGELYLGGAPLARGYAGRGDLTAARFVASPVGPIGERLYRTGDRARWNADGELEYLGRNDFQVKLRGQRIELGEIETVIAGTPGVTHAAAVVHGDAGEHLIGYYAPASVPVETVGDHVARLLPDYMRPSAWVPLERIPMSTAGKLDRRALPAAELVGTTEFVAPRTETEALVAGIIADVLGGARVGVTDAFFDIGGHSLSAMRVAARVSQALGVEVSVRDVFEHPSVAELVDAVHNRSGTSVPLAPMSPRPDPIPLSLAQQRIWFINQFDPSSGTYNVPTVLRLTGPLDVAALCSAVCDVVRRHEVLRTRYPAPEGIPEMVVDDDALIGERFDWAVVDSDDDLGEALTQGFDVGRGWPIRVRVRRLGPDDHLLAVVIHHIATDGESMRPLMTDLVGAYEARRRGAAPEFAPLPVQFADYAIWQHNTLGEPDDPASVLGRQLDYWRGHLDGLPAVLELPADRRRPEVASGNAGRCDFEITGEVGARIDAVAREFSATPFMVIHAALAVLLARCSATDDIAVGTPVAGRGRRELDALVGMFVNTLVLRTRYRPGLTFAEFLGAVRATDLEALAHSDVPFDVLVDAVSPARSEAFAPLVQVLLSYQRVDGDRTSAERIGQDVAGLRLASAGAAAGPGSGVPGADVLGAKTDLLFGVAAHDDDGPWHGSIIFATDLFDDHGVDRLAARFVGLLDQLTARPSAPIGDADLLEAAQARAAQSIAGPPRGRPRLLREIFADAARSHPDRTAVIDAAGRELTYAELDHESDLLAGWLVDHGIGPESLVALAIGRSTTLLTAIWAVAKSGAGYVPIDPEYPPERVANMIADSGAVLGFCVGATGELPGHGFRWVQIDAPEFAADLARRLHITRPGEVSAVRPENTAYVIYTSGSTGRPKGVCVSHTGLADFAQAESDCLEAGDAPVVLGFASPSFDASVLEYLLATTNGGTLVYRPADALGGSLLGDFMRAQAITHTFLTPSVLATLDPTGLPDLRSLAAGGEAVGTGIVDEWSPHTSIRNLYGPTETTIGVTISTALAPGAPVYLGTPLTGVALMVLDERLHPVPTGVPGELYVTGPALSRGYLDRPGLTSSRFVAGVVGAAGERMYRTGDVVRWRPDGAGGVHLEYSGRGDDQIKVRGLRIEPGEIEAALTAHPLVDAAVVVGVGEKVMDSLAAYVIPAVNARSSIDVDELRTELTRRLPAHMVPDTLTILDELPLTPVGKLDRRALPAPNVSAAEHVWPQTETEEEVARAYADILGVPSVSATASFFEIGGNSLSATQLLARLRGEHPEMQLSWVFRDPTVRGLAARLAAADTGTPDDSTTSARDVLLALRSEGSRTPLFCVHPAGGLAWFYGGLVRHLPDRPVYGLQDPHVVAGEEPAVDVAHLAQRYLAEIRRVAPHGPYHLLGWSLGGYVVHEMAARLTADGEQVGFVGVMDASPGGSEDVEQPGPGGEVIADALAGWRELFDLGPDVTASSPEEVAEVVRSQIASFGLLGADEVTRVMSSFDHAARIVADHRPRSLDAPMTVFTATRDKADPDAIARGWRPFVNGPLRNIDVDAGHLGMAEERALQVIGPHVEAALADWDDSDRARTRGEDQP